MPWHSGSWPTVFTACGMLARCAHVRSSRGLQTANRRFQTIQSEGNERAGSRNVLMIWILGVALAFVVALAIYDLTQRQHAILRTFPIVGHFRYWLEAVGPELRQYIVTDNDEERPFSRDQRRWIYASAKRGNNYFGFGSDNEMELQPSYLIIKHQPSRWRSVILAIQGSIR